MRSVRKHSADDEPTLDGRSQCALLFESREHYVLTDDRARALSCSVFNDALIPSQVIALDKESPSEFQRYIVVSDIATDAQRLVYNQVVCYSREVLTGQLGGTECTATLANSKTGTNANTVRIVITRFPAVPLGDDSAMLAIDTKSISNTILPILKGESEDYPESPSGKWPEDAELRITPVKGKQGEFMVAMDDLESIALLVDIFSIDRLRTNAVSDGILAFWPSGIKGSLVKSQNSQLYLLQPNVESAIRAKVTNFLFGASEGDVRSFLQNVAAAHPSLPPFVLVQFLPSYTTAAAEGTPSRSVPCAQVISMLSNDDRDAVVAHLNTLAVSDTKQLKVTVIDFAARAKLAHQNRKDANQDAEDGTGDAQAATPHKLASRY